MEAGVLGGLGVQQQDEVGGDVADEVAHQDGRHRHRQARLLVHHPVPPLGRDEGRMSGDGGQLWSVGGHGALDGSEGHHDLGVAEDDDDVGEGGHERSVEIGEGVPTIHVNDGAGSLKS